VNAAQRGCKRLSHVSRKAEAEHGVHYRVAGRGAAVGGRRQSAFFDGDAGVAALRGESFEVFVGDGFGDEHAGAVSKHA